MSSAKTFVETSSIQRRGKKPEREKTTATTVANSRRSALVSTAEFARKDRILAKRGGTGASTALAKSALSYVHGVTKRARPVNETTLIKHPISPSDVRSRLSCLATAPSKMLESKPSRQVVSSRWPTKGLAG